VRPRSATDAGSEMRSYYGRPVLQEPVWQPEIPFYFFTGGLAGASSVLSLVAQLKGNHALSKRSLYVGAVADTVSPLLLISDLGRPERFLNMLRVFKVTSPMSVGSWILLVSGGASNTAALLDATDRLPRVKLAAEVVSSIAGPPLATYTAALVANTAIPVWHEARRELPYVFAASSVASAGAAAAVVTRPRFAGPARRAAVGGAAAELLAMKAMERRLGFVGEPYRQGTAGRLAKLSKAFTAAGAAALAVGGRRRAVAAAGGTMLLTGEVLLRWSVFKAGFQSARDPRYTVEPQRRRLAEQAQPG
jgi:hypothetical protein